MHTNFHKINIEKNNCAYLQYQISGFSQIQFYYYWKEVSFLIIESVSFEGGPDEALALIQQQKELSHHNKTLSIIRPRAGSRILCLDGGGLRGLIQIEVKIKHIIVVTK